MHEDSEILEREFRESRLRTAALLEEAWSLLPPDDICKAAINGYKKFATPEDYHSPAAGKLTLALDRLEACAGRHQMSGEFWHILKHIAVMDAEYERTVRYRDRAATAWLHCGAVVRDKPMASSTKTKPKGPRPRDRELIKRVLQQALRAEFPHDTVDVSDGYLDNIHVAVVSEASTKCPSEKSSSGSGV